MDEIIKKPENDELLLLDKNYFAVEYPGQNIFGKNSFKKWYSIQSEKIKKENEIQNKKNKDKEFSEFFKNEDLANLVNIFSFISFCRNCQCYSIHNINNNSIFAKCFKCGKEYCVGCSIEKYSSDDNKICLKGYYQLLYLRMKFEDEKEKDLEFMEYIFLFVITIIIMPIYIPMISCFSYFNFHPNKPIKKEIINKNLYIELYKIFYPIFFSLLYFVYIFTFLPILFVISLIIFLVPFLRRKFLIIYEPIIG